jgi:EpsI family protein
MIGRAMVLSSAILAVGLFGTRAAGREAVPPRAQLSAFPRTLGAWSAPANVPLAPETLGVLRVDDYLNRIYVNSTTGERVSLFIGYYASQRRGDAIHSPQNCLPGAGWQPVEGRRAALDLNGSAVTVNRYVIERRSERQIAMYWYEGRGRIVANEYANKFWLMVDAARLGRSDGALVRVVAPVAGIGPDRAQAADAAAAEFSRLLLPQLPAYLP